MFNPKEKSKILKTAKKEVEMHCNSNNRHSDYSDYNDYVDDPDYTDGEYPDKSPDDWK